ncbi:MAG: cell division protein SepF [Firmicutes bacterium]|nr:cell division protein SepF [Bacillota bacterium]
MNFLWMQDDEEDDAAREEIVMHQPPAETGKRGTVVSLHSPKQHRVVLAEPKAFEEAQGISEHMKNKRQVILNLENTEKEVAQRILDFMSGACYAMDGRVQKVSPGVILFVPHNVDISNEMKSELEEKSFLPWLTNRERRI